ncbi:MAG: transcriptional regulator GlxA family with amidase domain, partial [Myxococcota bacterium]
MMAEMTSIPRFLPTTRQVVVLVPQGSQLIGLIGFIEALDAANRFRAARGQAPLYATRIAGLGQTAPSAAGPVLQTIPADTIEQVHTLILGGPPLDGGALTTALSPDLIVQARRLAAKAARCVSVCAGAFVLGELGLLDGRRCTSHWLVLDQLQARFPAARVEDDAIFTEDGPVLTSAGATAGIDLALHLIRQDGGARLALDVARVLVVFAQRPGGQSQFGSALRLRSGLDDRMRALVDRILSEPAADHSVAA